MSKIELQNLEQKLVEMEKPSFASEEAMKMNILEKVKFMQEVSKVGRETIIPAYQKARSRASILDRIECIPPVFTLFGFPGKGRVLTAAVLLVSFMVTYVFMFNSVVLEVPIAQATLISEIEGNVYVLREGLRLQAYENMLLQEKDVVYTEGDSIAAITYLDDSVSRLRGDTTIVLNRLFAHSKKKTFTVIEVELIRGDIWNRVVNLIDGASQFKVKTNQLSTNVSDNAAFSVKTEPDGTVKVKVVQNAVNVEKGTDGVEKKTVSEGYEAMVATVKTAIPARQEIVVEVQKTADNEEEKWIVANLKKDENYLKKIMEDGARDLKDEVGALPDTYSYSIKQIKGDAKLLLTLNDVDREKLKFDIANRRLKEAQVFLNEGKTDIAEEILREFKTETANFASFIGELKKTSPDEAFELELQVKGTFDQHMKGLAPVSEKDPLYKAKETLVEIAQSLDKKEENAVEVEENFDALVPQKLNFGKVPLISHFVNAGREPRVLDTVETIAPQIFDEQGVNLMQTAEIVDSSNTL